MVLCLSIGTEVGVRKMALLERKYYTFEQLAERWSQHEIRIEDIVQLCRTDELIPSVRLEEHNALAFIEIGKGEYQAVGNCYITGVFDASRNHVFDYLAQPDIYWLYPSELEYKIVSWSEQDRPRDLTGVLKDLPRWIPQPLEQCRSALMSFYAIPRQVVAYLGAPTDIRNLPLSEFLGLKQELKRSASVDGYVTTVPQSALEVVVLTQRIREFEQAQSLPSENAEYPESDLTSQEDLQQLREDWLLKLLNRSDNPKLAGHWYIQGQTQAQLWQALGSYSKDKNLFPSEGDKPSRRKKFFRIQDLCYWK